MVSVDDLPVPILMYAFCSRTWNTGSASSCALIKSILALAGWPTTLCEHAVHRFKIH